MHVKTMDGAVDSRAFWLNKGAIAEGENPLRWSAVEEEVAQVRAGTPGVCWLEGYTVIDVKGEETRAFLQGQLSNDVFALADGQAQWQGYCQPQGRLLATFPLIRVANDHFWALLPNGIAAAIAKRLTMFVLRSKLKVSGSDDLAVGFVNAGNVEGAALLLSDRALTRLPAAQIAPFWSNISQKMMPISASRWLLAGIDAGIGEIQAGGQDLFVPQTIGWDVVGVNYKKGCYPGQEVVARAHYRGAVKRKPVRLHGNGAMPVPGQELLAAGDDAGNLLCATETSPTGSWVALASVLPNVRKPGDLALDGLGTVRVELVGE